MSGLFYVETVSYSLKGPSEEFFSNKSCIIQKNLFYSNFSGLSALQEKRDRKAKREKPENKKKSLLGGR